MYKTLDKEKLILHVFVGSGCNMNVDGTIHLGVIIFIADEMNNFHSLSSLVIFNMFSRYPLTVG